MNYFAHQTAAERYARNRPYFHPLVIEHIRIFLRLSGSVPVAVDVACGTGLSTLALTEIADSVIATDLSPSMLAQAPIHPRIQYHTAPAEELPVQDQRADLMTVALAFHWFDRSRFLAEAHRVLRPGGTLVIYNNWFTGRMKENPEFAQWNRDHYFTRYPTPPRNDQPFTDQQAQDHHFIFTERENYTNDVSFSPEQFAQYLTTQSNVIAAVEQGTEPLEDAYAWLISTAGPLFPSPAATFHFAGEIWYLRSSSV